MTYAHDRTVARSSADRVAPRAPLGHTDRVVQADRMGDPALIVLGGDDPNLAGELARNLFEHDEARRLDAVVIGEEDTIEHPTAPARRAGSGRPGLFGFFRRSLELDHVAVRIVDVKRGAVALRAVAPFDLADGDAVPLQVRGQ